LDKGIERACRFGPWKFLSDSKPISLSTATNGKGSWPAKWYETAQSNTNYLVYYIPIFSETKNLPFKMSIS